MSKVERTLGKIVLKCPVLENSIKYSIGKGTERRKKIIDMKKKSWKEKDKKIEERNGREISLVLWLLMH